MTASSGRVGSAVDAGVSSAAASRGHSGLLTGQMPTGSGAIGGHCGRLCGHSGVMKRTRADICGHGADKTGQVEIWARAVDLVLPEGLGGHPRAGHKNFRRHPVLIEVPAGIGRTMVR